jgi:hypothetical protein
MPTNKPAFARVLCDVPALGLRVGQLLRAAPKTVARLAADGSVDAHPDAVAYAESIGAEVVSLDGFDAFADTQPAEDAPAPTPEAPPAPAPAPKPRARRSSTAE